MAKDSPTKGGLEVCLLLQRQGKELLESVKVT